MIKISVEQLTPGVKIAKPIHNANGMVLLGEGTVLTLPWIERLEDIGVEMVWIKGTPSQTLSKEEVLVQLDRRFSAVEEKPYMGLLKKAVKDHLESLYE